MPTRNTQMEKVETKQTNKYEVSTQTITFADIQMKQRLSGFNAVTLDVKEYAKINSLKRTPYDAFTVNGKSFPAGFSYELTANGITIQLKKVTNESYLSFIRLVNSDVKPENYVKYVTITYRWGKNRETNEEFCYTTFSCIYGLDKENDE